MKSPKISIIIPCYNTAEYLPECLASINTQTLKDIEIICIDDKSTDNTLDMLKSYAKKDKRIRVIAKNTNDGAGKSRNMGLDIATGDYVVFMDPDDYYPEPETLEKMYSGAFENGVDIAGGNVIKLTPDGKICEARFSKPGVRLYQNMPFSYGYTQFIFNREFLINNNIYFPDYRRYQDPPFFVKAMVLAKKYYAMTDAVYVYRVSYKTINWTERKVLDVLSGISDIMAISQEHKIYKLYIEQIFRCLWIT